MPLDLVTIEQSPQPEVLQMEAASVALPLSKQDQAFIEALTEKFLSIKGVGLAAPQVGVSKKIIVYGINQDAVFIRKHAQVVPTTVLINPHYSPADQAEIVYDWEGCFSVTSCTGKVPRYNHINYTAYLPDGTFIEEYAFGFTARVLQHEIDHVNGKLITDRLTPDCVQGSFEDMSKLRYAELSVEQLHHLLRLIEADNLSVPETDQRYQSLQNSKKMIKSLIEEKTG